MSYDITKFSFKETFLNTNGKTSSTKLIGMAASLMCILLFITMAVFYMFNVAESAVVIVIIDKIITFFTVSAGLMGVKSITSSFGTNNRITMDNTEVRKKKKKDYPSDCDCEDESYDDEEDRCRR